MNPSTLSGAATLSSGSLLHVPPGEFRNRPETLNRTAMLSCPSTPANWGPARMARNVPSFQICKIFEFFAGITEVTMDFNVFRCCLPAGEWALIRFDRLSISVAACVGVTNVLRSAVCSGYGRCNWGGVSKLLLALEKPMSDRFA
ncbi:hypothetical protein [Streptomyces sp. NPDC005077]|uniref:hypothetical protein n=1 Tax=unclassified Streptomyces TaxID=2593676 RepID=UPI0033AC58FE